MARSQKWWTTPVQHPGRWWGGFAGFFAIWLVIAFLVPTKRPHIEITEDGYTMVGVFEQGVSNRDAAKFWSCVSDADKACSAQLGLGPSTPYGQCIAQGMTTEEIAACKPLAPAGVLRQVGVCVKEICG